MSPDSCRPVCWVDGRLQPSDQPVWRPDDSGVIEGRACYTTARVRRGRPRFPERHWRRLARSARALGLPDVDEHSVRHALDALAAAAFPDGEGAVRLQASREGSGRLRLVGIPRGLGDEPATWRAVTFDAHTMPIDGGHKLSGRLGLALAMEAARAADAHEALLLDPGGRLVEGSRSNVFVADTTGRLATPPLPRGAVSGVARGLAMERVPAARERDLSLRDLRQASEIVAVNAVRGAVPIVGLDGRPVGRGEPGPRARELAAALDRD